MSDEKMLSEIRMGMAVKDIELVHTRLRIQAEDLRKRANQLDFLAEELESVTERMKK